MDNFLYEGKSSLLTNNERQYMDCIRTVMPGDLLLIPQASLASFVRRTDHARFQNELYRIVDFLITDKNYKPLLIIEINDVSHNTPDRRERDEKVKNICEEAGIPIMILWTSYGINPTYIQQKINTMLNTPVERIHHFSTAEKQNVMPQAPQTFQIPPTPQNTQAVSPDVPENRTNSGTSKIRFPTISRGFLTAALILCSVVVFMCGVSLINYFYSGDKSTINMISRQIPFYYLVVLYSAIVGFLATRTQKTRKTGFACIILAIIGCAGNLVVQFQ